MIEIPAGTRAYGIQLPIQAKSKTFVADLSFGGRKIERVRLDPGCRFPDKHPSDNIWPRPNVESTPSRSSCQ